MKLIYVPGTYHLRDVLPLQEDVQHRLLRVMRMGMGDVLHVFDGDGHAAEVEIADSKCRTVKVLSLLPEKIALERKILAIGIPKREAWETILRQATEMGVTEIRPLKTRFSQVARVNRERAQTLMVEAAEQCERYDLPVLHEVAGLDEFLAELKETCLWAYERLDGAGERACAHMVLVGPEGGFSAEEVSLLQGAQHIKAFSLGPTILRADTAVVASLAKL
jgi:16S rRNA (uracil1498-N3)-methyltransferase